MSQSADVKNGPFVLSGLRIKEGTTISLQCTQSVRGDRFLEVHMVLARENHLKTVRLEAQEITPDDFGNEPVFTVADVLDKERLQAKFAEAFINRLDGHEIRIFTYRGDSLFFVTCAIGHKSVGATCSRKELAGFFEAE